jgi:hypothetical protein
MSDAFLPLGTTIDIDGITLAEVKVLGRSGAKIDLIDATHLLSTSKEWVAGIPDQGEVKVQGQLTTGEEVSSMQDVFDAGVPVDGTVTVKKRSGETVFTQTFTGYVDAPEWNVAPNGLATVSFNLKITGDVETVPAS